MNRSSSVKPPVCCSSVLQKRWPSMPRREDGVWAQMVITLSPVSSSGQRRWPSLQQSWHNRSSNMRDSWKWLCNPPPGTHSTMYRGTQTHTQLIQYTSSQYKCSFREEYDFIYCQSGWFVAHTSKINQHLFYLYSYLSSGFSVWQCAVIFKDGEQNTQQVTSLFSSSNYLPSLKKFKRLNVTFNYFIQDAICPTLMLSFLLAILNCWPNTRTSGSNILGLQLFYNSKKFHYITPPVTLPFSVTQNYEHNRNFPQIWVNSFCIQSSFSP